jgi:hypothetical protein
MEHRVNASWGFCVQDKINAFWEITKKELEDKKAELRNKDREMEEMEERHQVEIKVYKQKVKHLLYEHQNNLSAQKADVEYSLKLQSDEFREREGELDVDKRRLKQDVKEREFTSQQHVLEMQRDHAKEITKLRQAFELQARMCCLPVLRNIVSECVRRGRRLFAWCASASTRIASSRAGANIHGQLPHAIICKRMRKVCASASCLRPLVSCETQAERQLHAARAGARAAEQVREANEDAARRPRGAAQAGGAPDGGAQERAHPRAHAQAPRRVHGDQKLLQRHHEQQFGPHQNVETGRRGDEEEGGTQREVDVRDQQREQAALGAAEPRSQGAAAAAARAACCTQCARCAG